MKIRTKRRALEEIPLASTADIAFLLIVFYLAASSLLEFRGVQIPLPKKDAPPMQVLRKDIFRIKVNAAGAFSHEGKTLSADQLATAVREALASNAQLVAIVSISPDAPVEVAPRLIQLLQKNQVTRLSLSMEGGR